MQYNDLVYGGRLLWCLSVMGGCNVMVPGDCGDAFPSILGLLRTRLRSFRVNGAEQREISSRMCYFWKSTYRVCGDRIRSYLLLWRRSSACKSWPTYGMRIIIAWGEDWMFLSWPTTPLYSGYFSWKLRSAISSVLTYFFCGKFARSWPDVFFLRINFIFCNWFLGFREKWLSVYGWAIFRIRFSHLLKSVSRLDVLATYLKWGNQFISSFLIEYFSSSDIFEILTSNFGYSNPSPIGLQFFCRAFGYLLKMVELIFSWIKDAVLSVSVDISITHIWFGRGETRTSPIFSMHCLDMLRKSISNLFWVNWFSFGRDLSPAFSILISCWHYDLIRFRRRKNVGPPILPNFQQCFPDL